MKADESKALIDEAGGLEAAKAILNGAPTGSAYAARFITVRNIGYYRCTKSCAQVWDFIKKQWIDCDWDSVRLEQCHIYIKLDDLRNQINGSQS